MLRFMLVLIWVGCASKHAFIRRVGCLHIYQCLFRYGSLSQKQNYIYQPKKASKHINWKGPKFWFPVEKHTNVATLYVPECLWGEPRWVASQLQPPRREAQERWWAWPPSALASKPLRVGLFVYQSLACLPRAASHLLCNLYNHWFIFRDQIS